MRSILWTIQKYMRSSWSIHSSFLNVCILIEWFIFCMIFRPFLYKFPFFYVNGPPVMSAFFFTQSNCVIVCQWLYFSQNLNMAYIKIMKFSNLWAVFNVLLISVREQKQFVYYSYMEKGFVFITIEVCPKVGEKNKMNHKQKVHLCISLECFRPRAIHVSLT